MTKCAHCEEFEGTYCLKNHAVKLVGYIPHSIDSNCDEIECDDFEYFDV